jgi:hypothetical protein
MRLPLLGLVILGLLGAPADASADDVDRREVPDLDGRAEPGADAVDALLWVPRIALSPLYLVSEFVIRRPLGFLITEIERGEVVQAILSFFTFGPERNIGVFPTALIDFGFSPSVGLYAFWKAFLFDENRISLHAAQWGLDWLSLTVRDVIEVSDVTSVAARFKAFRRPDQIYAGIGYDAPELAGEQGLDYSRYGVESIETSGEVMLRPWRSTFVGYHIEYVSRSFEDRAWGEDPRLGTFVTELGQDLPATFTTGYSDLRLALRGAFDTREPAAPPQGGVRIGGRIVQHVGLGAIDGSRFLEVGVDATVALELFGGHRVIGVTGELATIHALGGNTTIPFTELVDPGGTGPLPGFRDGALRGQSAATLTLHYSWPAWVFLRGRLHLAVGNVFGPDLEGFRLERLRMSFGIGLSPELGAAGEHPFELVIAVGTETFERGTEPSTVRIVFGTRNDL